MILPFAPPSTRQLKSGRPHHRGLYKTTPVSLPPCHAFVRAVSAQLSSPTRAMANDNNGAAVALPEGICSLLDT